MDRGYNFEGVCRWYAERADVILLFFDPDKPGTTGETLSILTNSLVGLDHKLHIILNKADQFHRINDFARAYGSLCWNLSKVIPRKDLPKIHTMCLPANAVQLDNQTNVSHNTESATSQGEDERDYRLDLPPSGRKKGAGSVTVRTFFDQGRVDLDEAREEVLKEVFNAPRRRVDNEISRLSDNLNALLMHCNLVERATTAYHSQLWRGRLLVAGTAVLSVALTAGAGYLFDHLASSSNSSVKADGSTSQPVKVAAKPSVVSGAKVKVDIPKASAVAAVQSSASSVVNTLQSVGVAFVNLFRFQSKPVLYGFCATDGLLSTALVNAYRLFALQKEAALQTSREQLETSFRQLYSADITKKDQYVLALGDLVIDHLVHNFSAETLVVCPSVRREDKSSLTRILSEDVANLRRRASPNFPMLAPVSTPVRNASSNFWNSNEKKHSPLPAVVDSLLSRVHSDLSIAGSLSTSMNEFPAVPHIFSSHYEQSPAELQHGLVGLLIDSEDVSSESLLPPEEASGKFVSVGERLHSDFITDLETAGQDPLDILIPNSVKTEGVDEEDYIFNEDGSDTKANKPEVVVNLTPNQKAPPTRGGILSLIKNSANRNNTTSSSSSSGVANRDRDKDKDSSLVEEYNDDPFHLKSEKEKLQKLAKAQRIKGVDIGFNAAASIEQNALLGKRPRDYLPSHRTRVRSLIAAMNHSTIATSHKNTKPDLMALELKYFHRPHMIREKDRPWQITCKNSTTKKSSGSSGSATPGGVGSSTPSHNTSPAHKSSSGTGSMAKIQFSEVDKQNLSLASNRENFVLLEYVEEFPPVMLNYGMASTIFNYYRAPKSNDEEEERRMKAKQETDKKYDSVLGASNRCRLPRHVLLLLQLRNSGQKPQYDYDVNIPRLTLGETKVLAAEDESPFLGAIDEGETQQAFVNNLFKAPIFKHRPHATDFLLIRTKLSQKVMSYSIRTIPYIYLCGQQEPLMMVPRPTNKVTAIQEKFYMLAASRYLQANFDGADFGDIQRSILKYVLKDKAAPHKSQHKKDLKSILKKVGEEHKDSITGEMKWYAKDGYEDDDGHHAAASEADRKFSAEEIAKSFSPEEVCLQESCNAAEYRLFCQNISDVDLSKVEAWLTLMHKIKQFKSERVQKVKRLASEAASKSSMAHLVAPLDRLVKFLTRDIERLNTKMGIARHIFERLVVAPWNTTEAYIRSHTEHDGLGRMELLGIGDPSGCGEGFAFVRILKNLGPGGTSVKKSTVKLVSTDRDLRKLTKKDAIMLLSGLGVTEAEALKLRRWDRIHMIREMSTRAEQSGVAKNLHKYARSDAANQSNVSGVGALETFPEKAQSIWNRQKAALSKKNVPPPVVAPVEMDVASNEKGKSSEGHSDSDSDDSDFDMEKQIERTLNARATATTNSEAKEAARLEESKRKFEEEKKELALMREERTGGKPSVASGLSVSVPGGLGGQSGSAITPKRKLNVGITSGSEASDASNAIAMQSEEAVAEARAAAERAAALNNWKRPTRVVKRTIKSVNAEGEETIRIEYHFAAREVDRVEFNSVNQKKERDRIRSGQSAEGAGHEEEAEDTHVGTTVASMSLNLGKLKKVRDQHKDAVQREKHKNTIGYIDQEENIYATKLANKSTKRNSVTTPLSYRLPRAALAARLEKELFDLWTSKNAHFFHFPVGRDVPLYHDKVASPISLSDIRDKIAHFKYDTAGAMIQDVELMARNAQAFNGAGHLITVTASKLVEKLRTSVNHEAVHFGADKDTIRLMEEAIRKKNVQFHRSEGSGLLLSSSHGSSGQSYKSHSSHSSASSHHHTSSSKMLPSAPATTHSMAPPPVIAVAQKPPTASAIQKINASGSSGDFSLSKSSLINLSAHDLALKSGDSEPDQLHQQQQGEEDDVMDSAGLWMD
eukprot:gene22021-28115_t